MGLFICHINLLFWGGGKHENTTNVNVFCFCIFRLRPQDGDPHEARLALGRLLGQALNLLDPEAAADVKAAAAASAALKALSNGNSTTTTTNNKTENSRSGPAGDKQQYAEAEMKAVAPETPPEVVDTKGPSSNGSRKGGPVEVGAHGGASFVSSNPAGATFGVGPALVGTTG